MKLHITILCIITIISLNSCALIFNGTKKAVTVQSMTHGADIYIDGSLEGQDAVTKKLTRKNAHTVLVKKSDCKSKTVLIESKTQAGWVVFDVLFNILAIVVDAPTGAWKTFDKSNVVVDLDCE
jgi:hypothetical protein